MKIIGKSTPFQICSNYDLRFFTLDPHSAWVWILTAFANDHFYYWEHRFLHETHIGWAAHQVHHSSQEMNYRLIHSSIMII